MIPRLLLTASLFVVALGFVSRPARADVFLVRGANGNVAPRSHRIVISHADGRTTFVESTELATDATQFIWLRAFPSAPEVASVDVAFDVLDERTIVPKPHVDEMMENLFGPSIVTAVLHALGPSRPKVPVSSDASMPRFELADVRSFHGRTTTSSTTGEVHLPDEFANWLALQSVSPTPLEKRVLAISLDNAWTIMAAVVTGRELPKDGVASLGPLRFSFASPEPLYPMMRSAARTGADVDHRFYVLGPRSLLPRDFSVAWDEKPWQAEKPGLDEFTVSYDRTIASAEPFLRDLAERGRLAIAADVSLVRASIRTQADTRRDMTFRPANEAHPIPGDGARDTGRDILTSMLLGLAPLVFAPESWFLLWLGTIWSTWRGVAREGSGARKLWGAYAFGVALFWLAATTGFGKLAAILPAVAGVARIARRGTTLQDAPVRVEFKKKRAPK